MRARSDMRFCGPFSRLPISVRTALSPGHFPGLWHCCLSTYRGSSGSRYIYDLYYEKEAISKTLYDWLLKNGYADANLIAKWKKQGYEKVRCMYRMTIEHPFTNIFLLLQLCCLRCIQTKETNFNATCICRVPKAQLKEDQTIECVGCGCRGCASSD